VRAIATTGSKRTTSVYSDLPTVAESGLPGFEVDLWLGIFAPKGLPADVKSKLSNTIAEILKDQDLKTAFAKVGAEPLGQTPDQAAATLKGEFDKWKKVIAEGNIKASE
jgi:tripartite-type tricarboxylate transporter receptor subunit TctC